MSRRAVKPEPAKPVDDYDRIFNERKVKRRTELYKRNKNEDQWRLQLWRFDVFLIVLHLVNFSVCVASAVRKPVGLSMGYFAYQNNSTCISGQDAFSTIGFYPVGEIHLKWLSAVFSLIECIEKVIRIRWTKDPKSWYWTKYLEKRIDPLRWVSYAVSSTLMTLINSRLAGQNTVSGLLTEGGVSVAMIMCGYLAERYDTRFFLVGCFFGSMIVTHDFLLLGTAPSPPTWVWFIIVSAYVFDFSFAVAAAFEIFSRGKRSYVYTLLAYAILSGGAKTNLTYQGVFSLGAF